MKVYKTEIDSLLIIEPDVYYDERGYFFESYNEQKYAVIGIKKKFVQDNQSSSQRGVVRGFHYQVGEFAQGKLVRVVKGRVMDYAVDIRFGSPTFGKYAAVELSSVNNKQFWIPSGFAHGFCTLENDTIMHYKCTAHYSPHNERGIIFNDPDIGINWPMINPVVSEKDLNYGRLRDINKDFYYREYK